MKPIAIKIATEDEIFKVGGKGTPIHNKCCTAFRAVELGCRVISGIPTNMLITGYDAIEPIYTITIIRIPSDVDKLFLISGSDISNIEAREENITYLSGFNKGDTQYVIKHSGRLKANYASPTTGTNILMVNIDIGDTYTICYRQIDAILKKKFTKTLSKKNTTYNWELMEAPGGDLIIP